VRWFSSRTCAGTPRFASVLLPRLIGLVSGLAFWASAAYAQSTDAIDPNSPGERALAARALRFQVARNLVKVESINAARGYSIGTGVVVAPGTVVTNCHVTREAVRIHLLWGGLRYAVAKQHADANHDICVLHAPQLEVASVGIADGVQTLRPGHSIVAAGFIGGQGLQVAQGEVVALHELDGAKVIQSTTAFTSGASGGGLFNLQGELIGILTFRLRGADAHYFSAPVQWIAAAALDPSRASKVAPIVGNAFWQGQRAVLPYFLQAAPLEAAGQWEELERLTQRWSSAENTNAEAWFMRGQAYTALRRGSDAVKALRRAVELDPNYEMAWYKLGLAYAGDCQREELKKVTEALARLDDQLSARLMQAAATSNLNQGKNYAC
jgi:S1-C subfamily serine protease